MCLLLKNISEVQGGFLWVSSQNEGKYFVLKKKSHKSSFTWIFFFPRNVLLDPDKICVSFSKFYFSVKNIIEFDRYLELKVCASAWNQQAKVNPHNLVQFSHFL